MKTFLQQVAAQILSTDAHILDRIVIVVPTRRASFFMMQELANLTTEPMISPTVQAIDDFVENACSLTIEDPVHLFLELYETFKLIDPNLQFDRFMGWASVLLSDLDKIDQYLVDTHFLFDYLSQARALERWQENLSSEQSLQPTNGTQQYFTLFQNINHVYTSFRERLLKNGKAYRGMAYRQLAEQADSLLVHRREVEKVYFCGFNAFTESEKTVVAALVKAGKATVLWDADSYYMTENTGVEAGRSLREYQNSKLFGDWNWTENNLSTSKKYITIYGVPNAVLQTKVAGQLYAEMKAADDPDRPVMTAIVLADENLLLPMLTSIDENVMDFNITMGLSLRNSLLYTLVDSIFELQQNVVEFRDKQGKTVRVPKFGHKSVNKVLNHPFIRHYEHVVLKPEDDGQTIVQKTLSQITDNNLVFLSSAELLEMGNDHPLFQVLFTHWPKNKSWHVISTFYLLIDLLRDVYKDYKNALETEYLYLFYTLLKQFEQTLEDQSEPLNLKTLRSFLYELIRQTKIPFSGEPVSNLQILGMLETRALDFERVIVLSVNEGILPQGKRQNSLIPFDAAQAAGLPTYQHQEAVMSYHFYHLLQRASEVHLLYTNTQDAPGGGEKSRFIQQLEFELSQYNPALVIRNKTVTLETVANELPDESVKKDDAMIAAIRAYLSGKGVYPTHLNEFVRCSMQFYLKHIVGVEEKEEVEEELGMDKIGTWLHTTLERLDKEYFLHETDPTEPQIKSILREEFERLFKGYVTDLGLNSIYFQVGEQQILTFLKHQMQLAPRRKILAAEQSLRTSIDLVLQGSHTKVNLGGKIDRIEASDDGTLFVMDYKTGSVEIASKQKFADPSTREDLIRHDADLKMGYVRQLWMYEFLMYRKMLDEKGLRLKGDTYEFGQHPVKSGFYSFRTPKAMISNPLELSEGLDTHLFIQKSERILTDILNDLLDPDTAFTKTNDLKICNFCDFRGICGR
jgi:hypothetical protein